MIYIPETGVRVDRDTRVRPNDHSNENVWSIHATRRGIDIHGTIISAGSMYVYPGPAGALCRGVIIANKEHALSARARAENDIDVRRGNWQAEKKNRLRLKVESSREKKLETPPAFLQELKAWLI